MRKRNYLPKNYISIIYNKLIHYSTTKYDPSPYIPKLIKKHVRMMILLNKLTLEIEM